jgi:hypothetical protein
VRVLPVAALLAFLSVIWVMNKIWDTVINEEQNDNRTDLVPEKQLEVK